MLLRFHLNNRILCFVLLLFAFSCKKKNDEYSVISTNPYDTTSYNLILPKYYPDIPFVNKMNLKVAKIQLGKKLYYEPLLSSFGKSCSSCHVNQMSFTNPQVNSLTHINLIFNKNFLWNGKIYNANLLEVMRFEVNDFFNTNPDNIKTEEYYLLFEKAYGDRIITKERIAECLAQYVSTLITGNSKFDKYLRGEAILSDSEFNGLNIFTSEKGDCFHCHPLPLFTDNQFHNIGLDSIPSQSGLYDITKNPADIGKFKTPALFNVAITSPYMHDGRFTTIEEVINHYNSGVKKSPTLDPIMTKRGLTLQLSLTEQEKQDLIAFLKTLTDSTLFTK